MIKSISKGGIASHPANGVEPNGLNTCQTYSMHNGKPTTFQQQF